MVFLRKTGAGRRVCVKEVAAARVYGIEKIERCEYNATGAMKAPVEW